MIHLSLMPSDRSLEAEEVLRAEYYWFFETVRHLHVRCDAIMAPHSLSRKAKVQTRKKQSAAVSPGASDLETSVEAAKERLFSDGQSRKFEEK